jgi:hypothetical protein
LIHIRSIKYWCMVAGLVELNILPSNVITDKF